MKYLSASQLSGFYLKNMPKPFDRMERVAALIQRQLSQIIHQERLCQNFSLVTLSHVEVARDLSHARVLVSTLDPNPDQVVAELNQAAKLLRSRLGKMSQLRRIPALRFVWDEELENQFRLGSILFKIDDRES